MPWPIVSFTEGAWKPNPQARRPLAMPSITKMSSISQNRRDPPSISARLDRNSVKSSRPKQRPTVAAKAAQAGRDTDGIDQMSIGRASASVPSVRVRSI